MFSVKNRQETLQKLQSETFDILVIGGGITGVGIALDAIGRGLKVALIEKQDFAAGTSSRSTKLIHGGLRYLKQLEFGLVREVGHERKIVYRNAPHIVEPERMLLPITEDGSFGKSSASLGIYAYDWLVGVKSSERRVVLNKENTFSREPILKKKGLEAGVVYWEYRTDDARLVTEIAKTAASDGALLVNYVQFDSFVHTDDAISGVLAIDLKTDNSMEIRARKTINAAGPWVDDIRKNDEEVKDKRLHLTKGVHLVFDHTRLPLKQSIYFDVSDGRMVFAIPRSEATYVGTTDTNYDGQKERPNITKDDVEYILSAANEAFEIEPLTQSDIRSSWAGLRPLIHEDGKSPSELSRKDEIFMSDQGLISIAGGKLTGYRKMAERTVDIALKQLHDEFNTPRAASKTHGRKLAGGGFHSYRAFLSDLGETPYSNKHIYDLYHRFGSNTFEILKLVNPNEKNADLALLLAELEYAVNEEMVTDLSDFLIRRTGRLYFEKALADKYAQVLNDQLAKLAGLSQNDAKKSLQTYLKESADVLSFTD
jgi:glycerol-3-phosphate dehydrogenase